MSAEKDSLDRAKKIWKTPAISWGILGWANLADAAADFILTFSGEINKQPPSTAEMMVIAFRWNKLNPSERKAKIEQSRLTDVKQAAPTWDPIVLMGSQPDDIKTADKIIAAYVPIVAPPSPAANFSGPITTSPAPTLKLTFGEPIAIPATPPEALKADDADSGKEPDKTLLTSASTPSPNSAPEIRVIAETDPGFVLSMPSEADMRKYEIEGLIARDTVNSFRRRVDELLDDEDFSPFENMPDSQMNYIQRALELRKETEKLFSMPINDRELIWSNIHDVIFKLNSRVEDINEKKYPTLESEYGYSHLRAKKGTEAKIEKKQKEDKPDIEVARLGSVITFCSTSEESYRGYNGDSSHGQDSTGVRQLSNSAGEVGGYHLIQTDGVSGGFKSEFLAQFLVNFLLKSPVTGERFLYEAAHLFHDSLSMEGTESLPDMLKEVLKQLLEDHGSSSTVNQIAIGLDGKVGGAFRGDGVLGVVRKNGEKKIYPFGSHLDVVQTLKANNINVLSVEDVTGGEEIILNEGDYILLSSDGLNHGEGKFEKVMDIVSSESTQDQLEEQILEVFWQKENIEDDKSLLIYHHQKAF